MTASGDGDLQVNRRRSAKWYILATISAVLTAGIALAAAWQLRQEYAAERASMEVRARITAKLQAAALAQPLWVFDQAQTDKLVEALTVDPDFKGVVLIDGQGKLMASLSLIHI